MKSGLGFAVAIPLWLILAVLAVWLYLHFKHHA